MTRSPLRRPKGPKNATPFPMTLSSMYLNILPVSSIRFDAKLCRPAVIDDDDEVNDDDDDDVVPPAAAATGTMLDDRCCCNSGCLNGKSSLKDKLFVRFAFFKLILCYDVPDVCKLNIFFFASVVFC